jgi:uncharacterized protein YggU (UPF0235/DUF167 family)
MIAVGPHPDGAILPVVAQPGAKRNAILGERAGALRVAVSAAPEKGKANEAIQGVLAAALDWRAARISLVAGATSRRKHFVVEGMTPEDLRARLVSLLQC